MSLVKCVQDDASSQPAPWQAELKAKKKQPRLAPKPAGKPKPPTPAGECTCIYSGATRATWWVRSDLNSKAESGWLLLLWPCLHLWCHDCLFLYFHGQLAKDSIPVPVGRLNSIDRGRPVCCMSPHDMHTHTAWHHTLWLIAVNCDYIRCVIIMVLILTVIAQKTDPPSNSIRPRLESNDGEGMYVLVCSWVYVCMSVCVCVCGVCSWVYVSVCGVCMCMCVYLWCCSK